MIERPTMLSINFAVLLLTFISTTLAVTDLDIQDGVDSFLSGVFGGFYSWEQTAGQGDYSEYASITAAFGSDIETIVSSYLDGYTSATEQSALDSVESQFTVDASSVLSANSFSAIYNSMASKYDIFDATGTVDDSFSNPTGYDSSSYTDDEGFGAVLDNVFTEFDDWKETAASSDLLAFSSFTASIAGDLGDIASSYDEVYSTAIKYSDLLPAYSTLQNQVYSYFQSNKGYQSQYNYFLGKAGISTSDNGISITGSPGVPAASSTEGSIGGARSTSSSEQDGTSSGPSSGNAQSTSESAANDESSSAELRSSTSTGLGNAVTPGSFCGLAAVIGFLGILF